MIRNSELVLILSNPSPRYHTCDVFASSFRGFLKSIARFVFFLLSDSEIKNTHRKILLQFFLRLFSCTNHEFSDRLDLPADTNWIRIIYWRSNKMCVRVCLYVHRTVEVWRILFCKQQTCYMCSDFSDTISTQILISNSCLFLSITFL